MDISKKYIEMCEGAEEIQKIGKEIPMLKGDDMFYHPSVDVVEIWCRWLQLEKGKDFLENLIWLPRQNELQEMVLKSFDVVEKIQALKDFIFITHKKIGPNDVWMTDDYIMSLESMEQLWLCYVMEEKFKKSWNGKEWI